MQGLFVPIARVGSGNPVRVLRLLHNKDAGYNWSIYCWDICTTCCYQTYVLSYSQMCTGWVLSTTDCRMIAALYCAVPFIVACVDVSRTVFRDRSLKTEDQNLARTFCSGGSRVSQMGEGAPTCYLAKICWKLHKNLENWTEITQSCPP